MRLPRFGVTTVCTAIAITIAGVRLIAPVPLEVLDRKFLDFRHLVRGPVAASDRVVIVAIDEPSLARLGRWPWPRARLAELIERLDAAGVTAIGFDIVLDQPETAVDRRALNAALDADPQRSAAALRDVVRDELDDDALLAAALQRSGHVVLAHFFEFGGAPAPELAQATAKLPEISVLALSGARLDAVPGPLAATRARVPIPPLATAAAGTGHINFVPDPDGLYRRLPVAVRVGDRLVPSLALDLLRVVGDGPASVTVAPAGVQSARVGTQELPVDGAGQLWIDFLGPPRTVSTVSAADVLAGTVPADRLAGRIALVGFTAAGFDEITTPFAAVMPGVEEQATVLDNLLEARSLRRPWWVVPAEAMVVVLIGLIVGPLLRWLRGGWGTAAAVALAVGVLRRHAAPLHANGTRGGRTLSLRRAGRLRGGRRGLPVGRRGGREATDPRRLPALRQPRDHRAHRARSRPRCDSAASDVPSRCCSRTSAGSPASPSGCRPRRSARCSTSTSRR